MSNLPATRANRAGAAALASDVQSGERPVSVDPTAHREKAIPRLMFLSRVTVALVVTTLAISTAFVACAGKDGASGQDGAIGPTGPQGTPGAPGVEGKPGSVGDAGTLSGACTTPCHTFNGVVDQWRFSNHSHPQNNEIGGGSCGNCHALDGIEQRVAGKFTVTPDAGAASNVPKGHISYVAANGAVSEIGYGGASAIGRIHCSTCHEFTPTTDPHVTGRYVAGQAPIRVSAGVNETAYLEKSLDGGVGVGQPVSYKRGNLCVYCHKSRKDVSVYITASNAMSSSRWGPHAGPQTDVFSGKGGFHFTGQAYSSSAHTALADACVSCHMRPVASNSNVPDHTMKPQVAFCKTCHTAYTGTDFDIQGGRTIVKNALFELQAALDQAGLLTRAEAAPYGELTDDEKADGQFQLDLARPKSGPGGANLVVDAATAGALYNYFIVGRSKDLGVHNPTYTKQLLWDSIKQIKGVNPTSIPSRPQ